MAFFQLGADKFGGERSVSYLVGKTHIRCGDLGVEHRIGQTSPARSVQNLEVLTPRMEYLHDFRAIKPWVQGGQVRAGEGVDARDTFLRRDLQQAELGKVGPFAQELRVERYPGRGSEFLAECLQALGVIDETHVGGRAHGSGAEVFGSPTEGDDLTRVTGLRRVILGETRRVRRILHRGVDVSPRLRHNTRSVCACSSVG